MTDCNFKRILFANPPSGLYRRDDRCQCTVDDQTVRIIFPPIEMAVHAAIAREAGIEAKISDYPAEKRDWEGFKEDLESFRPSVALFFVTAATLEVDLQACRAAKDFDPAIITIAKGDIFESKGEEILGEWPELDMALFGESEPSFKDLVGNCPKSEILGLVYRDEEGLVRSTLKPPPVADMDSLPLPARDLLRNDLYRSPETGRPLTVIHGNRGCPAKCIFCPAGGLSGHKLRLRSPKLLLNEIQSCVEDLGIREFLFHGDTFTMNKRFVLEICEGIIERGLKIRWGCNSRVDTMDDERAEAMKRAGCWVVAFGLESGVQEMLDKMKKGAKVERGREAIATCKRAGLRTLAFYIIGLPWETEATLAETFRYARELDTDFFDFNIAYPLPGTEFYDLALAEGLADREDLLGKGYAHAAVRTYELSPERLNQWRRRALLRLYCRPGFIIRTLWRARSPIVALNYARAAGRRFIQLLRPTG